MNYIIASHNKHKIKEFDRILKTLGINAITADLTEAEETGKTFMENALLKAELACKETGLPAIADDSGLCVDALDGRPGIYSARYAPEGTRKSTVLKELENVKKGDRGAYFACAIACVFPNGDKVLAEENCVGEISFELLGEGGFGYDPIFLCGEKSFAQMSDEEKDEVSHRGKALRLFKEKLETYLKEREK